MLDLRLRGIYLAGLSAGVYGKVWVRILGSSKSQGLEFRVGGLMFGLRKQSLGFGILGSGFRI